MTNQAAQTMPELLPCPFCGHHIPEFRARIKGDPKWHVIKCPDCPCKCEYCSSTEEQAVASWNRRTAISQTAGVPDVLFDGYAVYQGMTDEARARINAGGVSDVLDSVVRLIRAQGAPAASGGESAASLSSNPNPVTPSLSSESAASVSERVRVSLDLNNLPAEWPWDEGSPCLAPRPVGMVYPAVPTPRAFGYLDKTGVEWAAYDTGQMEEYGRRAFADGANTALRTLEQALTQQRVAASYDAGMAMHWIERYAAGIDEECQLDRIAEAFTTPQPSADAVREVIGSMLNFADVADKCELTEGNAQVAIRAWATQLESLLSGGPHA